MVNNNAAAALLILNTLAKGREVIVSLAQSVEIDSSFCLPEVMAMNDAVLREIGITNKTHLYDYERAINESTAAILQVHHSNYFKKAFHRLYQEKKLARLSEKVTLHSSVWEKAENFILEYLRLRRKITIAELRDHMKITRKYACAILEFLDRRGITKRALFRRPSGFHP